MTRMLVITTLVLALAGNVHAQQKPVEGDSKEYRQAYELLFDSRARAERAVVLLLPDGKSLLNVSEKELSLLCSAYNELGDGNKQLEAAKELWKRNPGSNSATRWMTNSLHNVFTFSNDSKPLFDFVDDALQKNQGNRRDLLVLKAAAILGGGKDVKDAEKRVAVSDLLIEAYRSGPPIPISDDDDFSIPDSPNFIDYDSQFSAYFSTQEREALKERMKNARQLAENERTKR